MKITNFEELFEAVKVLYDKGIHDYNDLELNKCFFSFNTNDHIFIMVHEISPQEVEDSCKKYLLSIRRPDWVAGASHEQRESKDPKRIYNLVKAIIKCED